MFSLRAISKIGITTAGLSLVIALMAGCSEKADVEPAAGDKPAETTLGSSASGAAVTPAPSDVITSEGKVITVPPSESSEPFYSPGTAGSPLIDDSSGQAQEPKTTEAPSEWHPHTDETYGFSIKYPDTYVILPETSALPAATPQVIHRVRFQDKQKASGSFADREPAQFSIHVFELDQPVELYDWLESQGLLPDQQSRAGRGSAGVEPVEPVQLEGVGAGWRVLLPILLAPREFDYFATERYVYRLTPLGLHSQDMLSTFRLSSG